MIKYTRIVSKLKHKMSGLSISLRNFHERRDRTKHASYADTIFTYIFSLLATSFASISFKQIPPCLANPTPRCSFTFTRRQSSNFPPPPSPPRRSTFFSKRHRNYASPSSLSFLLSFLLPPLDRLNFNPPSRGAGRD